MNRASAVVSAVNPAGPGKASVDVQMQGGTYTGLRYPQWYTPQVGDVVVVDWLGSQPYVSVAFF